jgi:leader peptidase (prepilin peptidase)/N-methyltransferase
VSWVGDAGLIAYLAGAFVFVLGAAVGSFLSVCVHRLPKEESIARPARSYCPACRTPLGALDLVPLVSFLALRARCRHCGARISWRYFALELVTGLLFAGAFFSRGGLSASSLDLVELGADLVFIAILVAAFFIDLETMLIPDELTVAGMGVGVAANLAVIIFWGKGLSRLTDPATGWSFRVPASIIGLIVGGAIFLAMELFSELVFKKEGMGGGDMKLAAALGSRFGVGPLLVSVGMAVVLGAVVGVGLIVAQRRKRKEYIPFGPFLAIAGLAMILWQGPMIEWVGRAFEAYRQAAFPAG